MSRVHLCEVAQIEDNIAPNAIPVVDLVKTAYEHGLFKKLKATSHREADSIELHELDAIRLIAYFSKRPEFTRHDNTSAGIHSVEFVSEDFDIEIYNSFMTIYRLAD